MPLPVLAEGDVTALVPGVSDVGAVTRGGQKIVFPGTIQGQRCAIKFMLARSDEGPSSQVEQSVDVLDEVTARARREVSVLRECNSPCLVRIGPIPLTRTEWNGQQLLYFTEELIDGEDLHRILAREQTLEVPPLIQLARNIGEAIRVLWTVAKIHRDVKPGNIMRRRVDGSFVLLDMGMVFDLEDDSITAAGFIPGTPIYFSPEQTEFARKRLMDFRSDLFSLGIVLYEAATGHHPFRTPDARSTRDVVGNILT